MKKKNSYINDQDKSSLKEPEIAYHTALPYMSRAKALEYGIPLEESKRILFEKIQQDFRQ